MESISEHESKSRGGEGEGEGEAASPEEQKAQECSIPGSQDDDLS